MAWADIDPGTSPPEMAIGAVRSEYELCKAIPGCNIGRDDIWRVSLTWAAWVAFSCIWQRQPVDVRPPLAEWAQRAWSDTRARLADRDALDASDPELISELSALDSRSPGLSLVPVQRGAVQWLARWRRDVLADARGNGKTPPLIRAMQVLAQTGGVPRAGHLPGLRAAVVAAQAGRLGTGDQDRDHRRPEEKAGAGHRRPGRGRCRRGDHRLVERPDAHPAGRLPGPGVRALRRARREGRQQAVGVRGARQGVPGLPAPAGDRRRGAPDG